MLRLFGLGGFLCLFGFAKESGPAEFGDLRGGLCFGDGEVSDFAHDPVEVSLTYGVEVGVGGGIHEVDGVGDAVFDGEFDGVEIVAEGAAECEGVFLDALEEFWIVGGRVLEVALVMGAARIVRHDVDLALADDVAAEVLVKVDRLLIHHAELVGLIVGLEEFFAIVNVVDIAPAAAVDRLHETVFANVGEDRVPIQGVFEIAHGAVGCAFGVFFVGQDHGGRDSDSELIGEGVVEEFVVGRPPEGIVDDESAIQSRVFEKGAIEGNVVGDAIDDGGIARCLTQRQSTSVDKFGLNAGDLARIDVFDESAGKAVFHAEQNADFFQFGPPQNNRVVKQP